MSHARMQVEQALATRYAIERELGSGAAATVYLAHDLRHDRKVAIKVLRPELTAMLGADRFLNEIRITARLNHPNIVPLFDSGEADGLLYYVMPVIEGETLREKLTREKQLGIDEALTITRGIADGLGYAHQQNVVHRDIKPENILFHRGAPLIADFGVARAIESASGERLTATGLSIGTPAYMSPEQALAQDVDERSDIHALAAVLYEMLAGDPPFTGKNVHAVMSKVIRETPTPLRYLRDTITDGIDAAVARALAKVPADRFGTAGEFVTALAERVPVMPASAGPQPAVTGVRRYRLRGEWRIAAGVATASSLVLLGTVAVIWFGRTDAGPFSRFAGMRLDSLRYVVLPDSLSANTGEHLLLTNALTRWTGIQVVPQVELARAGVTASPVGERRDRKNARAVRAGRYIRVDHALSRNGTRSMRLTLHETNTGNQLSEVSSPSLGADALPDSVIASMTDELILRGAGVRDMPESRPESRAFPAAVAFLHGHEAVAEWNLDAARSHFETALAGDANFARAALWIAQVRNWNGESASKRTVRALVERAGSARHRLPEREQPVADGLMHLASGNYAAACDVYSGLVAADPESFTGWWGLGECQSADHEVVPDRASPSLWSFRSSQHQAVIAYRRAFLLLTNRRGFNSRTAERLRAVLYVSRQRLRDARTARDYAANPEWRGDTLALTPWPAVDIASGRVEMPTTNAVVLDRHRTLFQEVASAWAAAFPASAHALEALALAHELVGDPETITTLRRARSLAKDPRLSARIAAQEIVLLVKLGTPDRATDLSRASALADSLLRAYRAGVPYDAATLAVVAALVGRVHDAAALQRETVSTGSGRTDLDRLLYSLSAVLHVYAVMGGPKDSVIAYERALHETIRNRVPPQDQSNVWTTHLLLTTSLALPHGLLSPSLRQLLPTDYPIVNAWGEFDGGNFTAARATLQEIESRQENFRAPEISIDAVYSKAALWAELGDTARAVQTLESTLDTLRWSEPGSLSGLHRAAPLIRALILRADLAAASGDTVNAARWAVPVTILWARADGLLQRDVVRMRKYASLSRTRTARMTSLPAARRPPFDGRY